MIRLLNFQFFGRGGSIFQYTSEGGPASFYGGPATLRGAWSGLGGGQRNLKRLLGIQFSGRMGHLNHWWEVVGLFSLNFQPLGRGRCHLQGDGLRHQLVYKTSYRVHCLAFQLVGVGWWGIHLEARAHILYGRGISWHVYNCQSGGRSHMFDQPSSG